MAENSVRSKLVTVACVELKQMSQGMKHAENTSLFAEVENEMISL